MFTPDRFLKLTALAWNHLRTYTTSPAEPQSWHWLMPEGCTTFEEVWAAERDEFNPLEHFVELEGGSVILDFDEQIASLFTPVRWAIFVVGPDLHHAYQEACSELARALGGDRCIYLADTIDNRSTGMNLADFEVSLQQQYGPPVPSLASLYEGDDVPTSTPSIIHASTSTISSTPQHMSGDWE